MFTFASNDAIYEPTWRERAIKVLAHWNRWRWLVLHNAQDNYSVYRETEELLRPEKGVD